MNLHLLQFPLAVVFLSIVFLHVSKKNLQTVFTYSVQSLAIAVMLTLFFLETRDVSILVLAVLVLVVKTIFIPIFLVRVIKKYTLTFSVRQYVSTPIALVIVALLTGVAHSQMFSALTTIIPGHQALLQIALSTLFLSLFLIVNSKGALTQIIGILSLEDSIVTFTLLAGLEQSLSLQIGILVDIVIWLIIAAFFVSLLYRHFGSLDVTAMKHLQE